MIGGACMRRHGSNGEKRTGLSNSKVEELLELGE